MKHPMQAIKTDEHGTDRFVENKIIRKLLDKGPFDMNSIAMWDVSREDRIQFAQLIGYSISGFGELSYVSDDAYETAYLIANMSVDSKKAELEMLQIKIDRARRLVSDLTTLLFNIHPDDLKS